MSNLNEWPGLLCRGEITTWPARLAAMIDWELSTIGDPMMDIAGFTGGMHDERFPDLTIENPELLVDGDRVVQTVTFAGTNTGGFMGMAPTGKRLLGVPSGDPLIDGDGGVGSATLGTQV